MEIPNLETFGPFVQQLSFGAVAGFAAGYALKKVGKLAALIVGLLFVFVQVLAYYGFVTIDWVEVQNRVNPLLETEALNSVWQGLVNVLTYNVTFAAAFIPALVLGLRRG